MTPAQLGALLAQHHAYNSPSAGAHARTTDPGRLSDGADLFAIAAMRRA